MLDVPPCFAGRLEGELATTRRTDKPREQSSSSFRSRRGAEICSRTIAATIGMHKRPAACAKSDVQRNELATSPRRNTCGGRRWILAPHGGGRGRDSEGEYPTTSTASIAARRRCEL